MATDTDPLTAELAAIRHRAEQITTEHGPGDCDLNGDACAGHDAERMAGALEAVLRAADDWITEQRGDHPLVGAAGRQVREIITRELLREDGTDDPQA